MPKANLVYWYGLSDMPRDGGGLRALAWHTSLTALGYDVEVYPLRAVGTGTGELGPIRRIKKSLIPMPFQGRLPIMRTADINVITVPSIFSAAAKSLPPESLVFDWMDLWSVNARTMAQSSGVMLPGGVAQSLWWKVLETRLPQRAAVNTYAGYKDYQNLSERSEAPSAWLPTPVARPSVIRPISEARPSRIGFLGNMNYPPNAMSLRKFLDSHAHRLERVGFELVVAGYGSDRVSNWTGGATILGPIEELATFYSSVDAVIVPIDHGGGIKVKAVESMVHGVPVYGTQHVREGFCPEFWPFIGDLNAFMETGNERVLPAPQELLEERFSDSSFRSGVQDLLIQAGFHSFSR